MDKVQKSKSANSYIAKSLRLFSQEEKENKENCDQSQKSESVGGKDEENSAAAASAVAIQSKFHFVDLAGSERAKKTGS